MKSWKTTGCGILALVGGGLMQFYPEQAKLGGFLAFLGSGLGLLFARDNNVSSEDVGADEATKVIKKFSQGPLPMILLTGLLAFASVATFTGCQTTQTREAAVFNTFKDTWTVAHSAYQAHCENVVNGKVKKEKEAKVDAAWNKFRLVFKASLAVAHQDWTKPAPATLDEAEHQLLILIRTL